MDLIVKYDGGIFLFRLLLLGLVLIRKENQIKTRCVTFGVNYIERRQDETAAEKEQRHITFKANDRERRKRARAQQSPEECRSTQDANTVARKQEKSTAVA